VAFEALPLFLTESFSKLTVGRREGGSVESTSDGSAVNLGIKFANQLDWGKSQRGIEKGVN
jgi:hypothetical protein